MLFLKDLKEIVTSSGNLPLGGEEQGKVKIYKNYSIFLKDGIIKAIGKKDKIFKEFPEVKKAKEIEGKSLVAFPGFVDCHTHLVFAGQRREEFSLKLKGVPYMEIAKKGGGILSTLKSTRKISFDNLLSESKKKIERSISYGVTTIEIKSGYGLNLKDEIKQLKVIKKLKEIFKINIIPTLMSAHEIPPEYKENRNGYINLIINEIIPKVSKEGLAKFCDVFCEKGVFTPEETIFILNKAKEFGFDLKVHADEFAPSGGAEVAGKLNCISAEHLLNPNEEGIKLMGKSGTVAVLLPGVLFFLKIKKLPPIETFKKYNVPIALATDFNPGSSPTQNIQLIARLGVFLLGLKPEEVLNAITINGASALSLSNRIGTIELGKDADLTLWEMDNWLDFFYWFGEDFLKYTISKGKILWKR